MSEVNKVDFEVIWEDRPSGLFQRFLTLIHMNFTKYQITKDELIIETGFFKKIQTSSELYLLKDADSSQSLWQRILGIGTVSVHVDKDNKDSEKGGKTIYIKNIKNYKEVRKILRDAIEEDVMERKITYFDKV